MGEQSEEALIRQTAKGSRTAFGALVQPHLSRLIVLATRMLSSSHQAEDALQDALASVWLARHRLRPDRPIGPFLTTVTLNKCRDRLRKRKAAQFFGLDDGQSTLELPDSSPGPESAAASREELRRLQAEMEKLPIRLREALVLVAIDGRSQAEAASLLGVSEKAIETRVYRARKQLRERLGISFEG